MAFPEGTGQAKSNFLNGPNDIGRNGCSKAKRATEVWERMMRRLMEGNIRRHFGGGRKCGCKISRPKRIGVRNGNESIQSAPSLGHEKGLGPWHPNGIIDFPFLWGENAFGEKQKDGNRQWLESGERCQHKKWWKINNI